MNKTISAGIDPDKYGRYLAYLESSEWAGKRSEALIRAGHKCQLCSELRGLDAHHNTYARLYAEHPTDIVILCRNCHNRHHGHEGDTKVAITGDPKRFQNRAKVKRWRRETNRPAEVEVSFNDQNICELSVAFIHSLTPYGATLSREQARALGLHFPLKKGWMKRASSMSVTRSAYDKLISERDRWFAKVAAKSRRAKPQE